MPAILRIDVDKPFLMWGSAPRPRKPSRGLKKSFTKRTFLPSVKTSAEKSPIVFSFLLAQVFFFGKKKKCGAACGSYKGFCDTYLCKDESKGYWRSIGLCMFP
jgi:hypothetical protein